MTEAEGIKKEREFLIGLEKLTRVTGIMIGGCGCCGSPFLEEAKITDERSGYIWEGQVIWVDPSDEYDWKKYSKYIVKEKE